MINFIGTRRINFNSKIGPFLEKIFGIGSEGARIICLRAGVPYNVRFSDVSEDVIESIDSSVRLFFVSEPELRRRVSRCLRIRIRSGCYRGVRLSQGLPSRGQRSRTNARTIRALREKIFMQVKQDLLLNLVYMFNTTILFYRRRIKIDFDNPKPYYESFEDLFKTKKQLKRERLIRKQIRLEKIKKKIAAELWARLDKLKEKKRLKEEKEQLKLKLAEEKRLLKLEKIKIKKNE